MKTLHGLPLRHLVKARVDEIVAKLDLTGFLLMDFFHGEIPCFVLSYQQSTCPPSGEELSSVESRGVCLGPRRSCGDFP